MTIRRKVELGCYGAGISRAELARRVGKLPQALNDMLTRGDMKASLLKDIADKLDVSMEWLMLEISEEVYEAEKARLVGQKKESFFK